MAGVGLIASCCGSARRVGEGKGSTKVERLLSSSSSLIGVSMSAEVLSSIGEETLGKEVKQCG